MKYRRVLLKISGEALGNKESSGIDKGSIDAIVGGILDLAQKGIEVGIVVGGGNILRGAEGAHKLLLDRTVADQMGMLATIINAMALKEALLAKKHKSVIMSAIDCSVISEKMSIEAAKQHLSDGTIVLFAGGTGNPFFTTDTAAALRAAEIQANILMKATKVDGVYSADPFRDPSAIRYATLSYQDLLAQKLEVMDATSVQLCMMQKIPIVVFNMQEAKFSKVLEHPELGTYIQ
jgi:uridylate kinase